MKKFLVICFVAVLSIALRKILLADGGTVVVIQVIDGRDGNDGQIPIRIYDSIMPSSQWKTRFPDGKITGKAMVPEISSCDAMESPAGPGKWIAILNGSKIKETHCSLDAIVSTAKKSQFSAAILYNKKYLDISDDLAKDDGIVPFVVIRETNAENLINHYSYNSGKDYLVKIVFFTPVKDKGNTSQDDDSSTYWFAYGILAILIISLIGLVFYIIKYKIWNFRQRSEEPLEPVNTSPTNVIQDEKQSIDEQQM